MRHAIHIVSTEGDMGGLCIRLAGTLEELDALLYDFSGPDYKNEWENYAMRHGELLLLEWDRARRERFVKRYIDPRRLWDGVVNVSKLLT